MNEIFRYFIGNVDSEKRLAYAAWFVDNFPITEFKADELLFWEYMSYSSTLGVPLRRHTLDVWLSTSLRKLLLKHNVKVPGCESINYTDPVAFETAVLTTKQVLQDDFTVLESMESNTDDFVIDLAGFIQQRRGERITQILTESYAKLSETEDNVLVSDYILEAVTALNDIYNEDLLEDFNEAKNSLKRKKVADHGIPAIDQDSGGIYTTQLIGIEAQPGTGKTRYALGNVIYRALTVYKTNCLFISLEQNVDELEAILVAKHCFQMFGIIVNDALILREEVPTELQSQVAAAKLDLFESGKYGKCVLLREDFYVETFIARLRHLDRLKGPFELIAIDYMGLFESKPAKWAKHLDDYEIIGKAFKFFKRYLSKSNKAGIAVSQLNKSGIEAGKSDKEITTDMAQGGITVYRNTDYNIAITMTDTMRAQQKRKFQQPKVRSSAGFGSFIADTRLGVSYFNQIANREV